MHLCLLRHGQAEKMGVLYTQDNMRPLSPQGVEEIENVAHALQRMGVRFDLILTSPALRARQSAEIVARTCNYQKDPEMDETLGGRFSPEMAAKNLATLPPDFTVLLVGHSPMLGKLIAYLISNDESTKVEMKEAALAWIEVSNPTFRTGKLYGLLPAEVWRK